MVPKLRFKNFEGIWEPKSLKDIACLTSSKRVHLSDYVKEGIPFFRGKEITELKSGIIPSDILYISPLLFNEFKVKYGTPKAGEILITAVGTLGNIYHINNIGDFYFKDGNLIWLKELKCNSLFLSFLLTFKKNEILNSAIGSTQKALTMVELNKLVFNYPRNDEQVKIASFLSLLEEKIMLLNKQYDLLCRYKKGMMQKIFSQEVRFMDEHGGVFPEWSETLLGDIATFYNGRAYKQTEWENNGIPVIRLQNLTGSGTEYYYSNLILPDHQYCDNGDLLYMWSATMGPVWWKGPKAIFHYHIWKIVSINGKSVEGFIYYILDNITQRMLNEANGTTMAHITKSGIEKECVYLPSLREQTKIANFLSALDDKIAVKKAELDKLKIWKQGLLQQMFV